MNAAWLAAAWAGIGVMAGLGPARLRRPIALIAPLLLVALSIATVQGGARPEELGGGGLALPREAAGLLAASAAALWLCLLLADRLDGRELIGIGTVGGAVVLLLSTGSPLLFGVAAMLAVAALSLRWISVAPGRASLATARVAGTGAAALIAVSLLLPAVSPAGQPGMVGGLLVVGVLALAAVMPLGGWAVGALSDVPAPEIATWLVLLAPAVLLSAFAIPAPLPLLARLAFEHTILACGLISAIWAGVMSLRAGPATRYGRVALGDLGLVAAGVGTGEAGARARGRRPAAHPHPPGRRPDPPAEAATWAGPPPPAGLARHLRASPLPGVLGTVPDPPGVRRLQLRSRRRLPGRRGAGDRYGRPQRRSGRTG
jgi:hypothetical protein